MINNNVIKFNDHISWLTKILKNKSEYFYSIIIDNKVSGALRITRNQSSAEWSFYITKKKQRIYGSFIEYLAIRKMFSLQDIKLIICKVFDFNTSVISLHKKFGFKYIRKEKVKNNYLFFFELKKNNWNIKKILIKKKLKI